ncbi:1528_t:CDS:1, partial [Funneliformis mosseae]
YNIEERAKDYKEPDPYNITEEKFYDRKSDTYHQREDFRRRQNCYKSRY